MCSLASAQFFGIVPRGHPERCRSACPTAPTPHTAPSCAGLGGSAKRSWEGKEAVSLRFDFFQALNKPKRAPPTWGGTRRVAHLSVWAPQAGLKAGREGSGYLCGTSIPTEIPRQECFLNIFPPEPQARLGGGARSGREFPKMYDKMAQ